MPKTARNGSEGMYQVMVCGYRECPIFHKDQDKEEYIRLIRDYRKVTGIHVYAYLVEENAAHMVVESFREGQLSDFMKRIGISYSRYFRRLYAVERGRIFRDRFTSRRIHDRKELLESVRVLHRDSRGRIRPYSSYREYYRLDPGIDTRRIMEEISYSSFASESAPGRKQNGNDRLQERREKAAYSDREARKMLEEAIEKAREKDPFGESEKWLEDAVSALRKGKKISIRQLARVSGLSKSKVGRIR